MKTSDALTDLIEKTRRLQRLHVNEEGLYDPALVEIEDMLHRKRFEARFRERYPNGYPTVSWFARLWSRLSPGAGHRDQTPDVAGLAPQH